VLVDSIPGVSPEAVHCFNTATGEVKFIGDVPDAVSFAFGNDRQVYVRTASGDIHCYPLGSDIWEITASATPPNPIADLVFDDATKKLFAVSAAGDAIYAFDQGLISTPATTRLPAVQDFEFAGDGSVAVSPFDGSLFITSEGSDSILHITSLGNRATVETIAAGLLVSPRCLNVGDDGRLFVVSDDVLREFRAGGGGWSESTASNFTGLQVGRCLDIPHSRSNFDPETMPFPPYRNVLPDQFAPTPPVCPADLNGDDNVDGRDLAAILAAWRQPGDLTDLNGDGTTDGMDLAAILAAWGPCP